MSEVDKFLDSYEAPKTSGQKPAAPAAKPASEVDSLMETAPPQDKGFLGHARDLGLAAVKSAIAVPETLVGLANIPTGGRVGKFLENEDGAVGFRPKQAKEFLGEFHTEAYKDQQRQFQEADGILDKTAVAIQNPSLIANTVVESAAPMLAGGVAARGLLAGTRMGQMGAKGAAAAGAIGEGAMMAGAQAEAIRQETDDGLLTPTQAGAAVATGLAGTLFGYLGGRVAQRFGLGDVDTMLARGANPQQVASEIAALPAKSIPRQVVEGAISEGFLEELPQSISEQIIQNLALGKQWSEGVEDAAVMGTLAGMAMGGGASLYSGMTRPEPQDGGLPPPAAGNEPPAAPPQGFAPTSERPVIDESALGRAGIFPPAPAPIINERALEPTAPTPSQQMGLDPAAGPMSAAAALAVDTGASATMQQAAQSVDPETGEILETGARVPEQKQPTDTPEQMRERLGFIEQQARVNGGWDRRTIEERDRLQAELAKAEPAADQVRGATERVEPAPAIDVSGRTDEQLRVLEKAGRDGWREAAVAEIQRRAAQQMGNATGDTLGDASTPDAKAKGAAKQVLAQGGSEADAGRAATDSLIEDMAKNPGISIAEQAPAAVKAAKAEIEKPAAAPQAAAAPAADIKAVLAKQIPDMTDGELQQAIAHYGPSNKRTAKLQKELQKRGQGAQTTAAIAPGDSVQIADGLGSDVDGQPGRVVSVRGDTASVEVAGERYDDVPVSELKKQVSAAASEGWDGMTAEQRAAVLTKPGGWSTAKGKLNVIGKQIAGRNWSAINPTTRATIERLMQGAPDVQPAQVDAASGQGSGAIPAGSAGVAPSRPVDVGRGGRPAEAPAPGSAAGVPVGNPVVQQPASVESVLDAASPFAQPVAPQGAQPTNVPPTQQVAPQAQEARGQEGEGARTQSQAAVTPAAERFDSQSGTARPQPGEDGYTLELAREDLAALRAELKKQGEDGRPADSRLNDRVRNFEKLVASMESAQKREQPAQASDDDIDAMFDDALADAIGEQQTGDAEPAATAEAPAATAVATEQPANQEAMAESLEDELRAQKKRVQRLRGGDATKIKAAEARLRAMRQSIFDAEDKWVPDARNGDQEALTKLEEAGFADTADAIRAFAPAAPRTAGKALKSAAKNAASALDDAINGLGKLFGGGGRLSSGLTFDEETYAKAKPLFIAAAANIRAASRDLRDVMKAVVDMVVERFGADTAKNMKPYVTQFVKDVRDGKVQLEQEQEGNEPAADGAQDQGRAEAVRGGRGDSQPGSAPADSGSVAPRQSEDGRPAGEAGDSGRSGVRVPGADVARGEGQPKGRVSGDGRARAGGAGSPDAGAGGAGSAGDLGGVSSPAATSAQAQDLHVDNPLEIVGGSPVQRFNRNRAALELLQALTEEGRQATPDEQKVLAGYIGWGSFGQELFQGSWERPVYKDEGIWKERGQWLRDTLGESAWKSAQRSITNAHYTDPPTVLAMWDMVRRMGFEGGKVLEPSMGTGNFFSMMPADLKARSQLTGIELDETTGAIAKQLFPRSNVRIMGYQDSKTPDGFYDLIIGNWPFENTPVADRRYNKLNPMLHDYFFLKTMDQVRPGGIVIGITSAGSMDKQNTTIRRELAKQAELVEAIRLPSGAFEEYAGTKVVTDIVVLRKRPQRLVATPSDATWVETGEYKTPAGETIKVNRYYLDNPQNIIGTLDFGSGTTTFRAGMIVRRPENMAEQLQKAIELVPQGAMLPRGKVDHLTYYANETGERHGALALVNDRLMIAVGDQLVEANEARKYALKDAKKTAVREQQLRAAIDLRKKHAALVDAERGGRPADDARKALRGAYDAFVKAHGGLRDSFALEYLERINDPFFAELAALENDDGTPAAVMERSTTRGRRTLDNPSVRDAYVLARNQSVNPSVAEVARLAGKSEQAVKAELLDSGAVFEAPNGDVVPSDIYLSGNVRQKLRDAQAALDDGNTAMRVNVAALKEVMPEDVPYFNIETQLGATWVPNEAYAQYIAHMLGQSSPKGIEVSFRAGRWKVKMESGLSRIPEAATNYGTSAYPFGRLVQAAISNQVLRLTSKDENNKDVYDAERSEEANARIAKIREDFGAWLWSDPERRQDLEREYNEARNAWATPTYDGSFLTFEGMALTLGNGAFQLRQHQVNAIWRAIVNRRSINAHEVGTGKTFTMGGIAVESRRYGIAKKPMLLAHNANSATVAAEIRMMYPSARVLYVDNLQGDKKEIRLRQIANDDWDVIVVPHSLISNLALREETMMRMAEDDIKALEAEFFDAAREDGINPETIDLDDDKEISKIRSVTAKELAKARKRIVENIKKQAQKSSKEGAIAFEDLGVDMILVDEVHEFKKPPIVTRMKMKGLNTQISNRSIALQFLTRYVRQMNNGGNVHTFTGTPITNTITEIYHQMRYVMEAEMEQATIADWDGWFGSFAAEVQDVELTAAGDYETVSRLAGFVNVPELRAMVGQYMDTVFAEDMPEMRPRKVNGKELSDPALTEAERAELLNGRTEGAKDRPYKKVVNDSADMTAEQMRIFTRLQQYAREFRDATGKQKKEWMLAGDPRSPLITEGIVSKASFDARLLDDEGFAGQEGRVPDEPTSKASRVVKNVLEIYNSHPNANQVIFSDTGFGKRATRSAGVHDGEKQTYTVPVFATMHDILERLVQGGIPREQIAIVDGSTSKERRKEIAEAMNSSKIRVVIGSTDTLGVGVNMQRNLRAMHHVDAPYMPGELEQRNGRGMRQRNQWNTVLEYRYMTDRLDGKRWQILAVKQRFINAFMKAAAGTRVIEGEAAADEQSDILESFSEAAGDPRILQRVKMQKKLETLHRKERMYTQGIADMRRQERSSAEIADRLTRELKQLADSRTQANVEALIASQQQAFAATIDGTTYDTRKDAADALQAFIEANVRIGDSMKTVGGYAGHPLRIEWPRHMDVPVTQIDAFGQEFAGKGIAGAEAKMRNFPSVIENKVKRRDMERSTAENMRAAMNQPFAQAADLERITKQLQDLEKDLEINPVPPPAWLRQGAPIDSEVHRNKRPYIVTGHRYSKEGWFVIAEDDKGTVLIPYMEATDEVGMPMYEEREFVPPVVIETKKEDAAPADALADVVVDRAAQSATANPLRNADGTFARQDPADDSMAFSATLPRDRNAVRIGITEKGLVRAMRLQFDGLADVTSKLLERGRAGKRGGVIVVGTADNAEIGRIVAERTGRKLDSTMRKFSSAGRLNGFYDPKTGLTFLVGPNLNPVTATAVMLHEMMHGQQRQKIDARALEMVRNRHSLKDEDLRAFLDRVMLRMIGAGEVGNAAEASAYIVEQAVIEGRSAGYAFADNAFMQWVDAKIGKRVGDFLRSFAGMIRTWMLRNGLGAKTMTVDDFVGYAMAGLDRAASGEVRAGAMKASASIGARAPQSEAFRRWFGDSKVVDASGQPLVVYHGTDANITEFKVSERGTYGGGIYLTPDTKGASDYAIYRGQQSPTVYPLYASIKNPATGAEAARIASWRGEENARAELIARGYDGVIDMRSGEIVAFYPEQIKSATGNNGDFDPDNDDIRFSRSGMRELASRATTELNQTLSAPGKLSWWHKTIGTMYNLAERSPAFRPVFQAAQGFIDDVSHYAADAAERAPKLLPRLETWRDIMKSPISAEDNKAVGKPIFEGTLSWTRDADGRPVRVDALIEAAAGLSIEEMADELVSRGAIEERTLRMWRGMPDAQFESAIRTRYENSFLQPGIVWTDDELARMFSLTPAQIELYREFRAAVDRSLDTMARADMLRFAGEDVRFLRDPVMEAETLREAASLIVMNLSEQANAQPDRAEQLMATGQGVMDRMQKVLKLQAQGYAPLSRFGKYTVDVAVDGNREYFGLFETAREANKMAERMRAEFGAGTVTQGTLSDEAFRLFAGITPESLELFGNMLGLDSTGDEAQDRAFQEYLRLTKTNRSALRRLIHRKGIAGFSEDVGRVLASFAYSNARQTAAGLHMGDLSQAVSDIPKEQGELKDAAVKLSEYIKNPQEEAQAIRGLLFAQYLGGSVASAFVNMTQPAAVTFPWLSQHGGAKMAAAEIGKAAKHIATRGHRYESDLAEALKAAEEDGVVSPQEVHQLMAQARGSGSLTAGDGTRAGNARALASNSITRLSAAWGKLFSAAEQLNRRITFIAAYRVAKQKRMEDPAAFARRAVQETQFVYSKASKMQWGRGAVGGTLMTFKTYSVAYMELMSRLWSQGAPGSAERKAGRKAVALMLAMVLLMGGGGGLPFMEDAEDLIDGIAQIAGYNFSTKKARQQFLIDTFGADAADFIERGVSGLPGVPLDVSGRLGLGNLIPGTGIFLDRSNHTRDVLELLGPVGDLGNRIVTGARKALSGDLGGAALEVSPVAVRNVAKGVDMAVMDQYRDTRGRKVLETTDLEAALKAIGFQPASVAKVQDANYLNQRAKDFYSLSADRISAAWAAGIYEKDSGKVQEARDMIAQWNEDNPDQPMMIRMPNILRRVREMGKDKAQRIADTAPRAMRQQLREELLRQ